MQNYKELLTSTHPIFRVPATRVFWFDQVTNNNCTNQAKQQRYLAITSPGIFLFERRTFPKGFTNAQYIPYSELAFICADSNSMQFFGSKITMNLSHPKYIEVVSIVIAIQKALFENHPKQPKIDIDPDLEEQIEKFKFNFDSDVLIADRFLSLSIGIESKLLVPDQINDIVENLKSSSQSIQISAEMITSHLIEPITLAIAYDNNVQSLHLKNMNFPSFVHHFNPIILHNSSIQRLYLSAVSFNGKLTHYLDVWNDKTSFSANQFIFNDCQLTTSDFVTFMKSFKFYPADIASLIFIHSNLNTLAMETIFSTISRSPCFRTLTELYFSEMRCNDAIQTCFIQFFSSDFLTEQKNLRILSLVNVGIELDQVLPYLLHNKSTFSSLSLAGNKFLNATDVTDFQNIEDLNLSGVSFTAASLLNLLNSLSKAENSPPHLTLDQLVLEEGEWDLFYQQFVDIVIPKLTMLSWCGNKLKSKEMRQFKKFILKQPVLTDIGLSHSLPQEDADDSIRILIEILHDKPIKKLEIRGSPNNNLSQKLLPLLNELLRKGSIKMLDITGQEIGDAGLELLMQLVKHGLEELRFDGSTPTDADFLLEVVTFISQSSLITSDWPESDCKQIISKVGVPSRQQFIRQLETIKKQFVQKFTQNEIVNYDKDAYSLHCEISDAPIRPRMNSILAKRRKDESQMSMPPQLDLNILSFREEYIDSALLECFGIDTNNTNTDPLICALEKMNDETSIPTFLQKHQQL
ncbi:hypothetical protein TRFO_21658 [Tritrichomonas foetus]|uniref:Leucine Rich Repeat family protein n=1 Tax=Tritrichomonas foetus TaxID=1144522 RepID=A0A1J4KEH8_9EUKA|nr:hypothetical protein TRFO_21658 [Tritrichomonas foetus]|eukprot:OHT09426.1 hypothetical protein TRFO_21658 [Tritrichomonas foetus]